MRVVATTVTFDRESVCAGWAIDLTWFWICFANFVPEGDMATPYTPIQKLVVSTEPLGKQWGMAVQELVIESARDIAQRLLEAGTYSEDEEVVEVRVPVNIHVLLPRKGKHIDFAIAADAGCICSWTSYPEGGGVCKCTGPGAGNCDCEHLV
jgi:hypothetical protein